MTCTSATAGPGRPSVQSGRHTEKVPTSVGYGGAVTSVDPEASAAGLRVLKHGGSVRHRLCPTTVTDELQSN